MATEIHSTVSLRFSADPRLAAAAACVARYFADAAGMESGAAAKLQSDALAACRAAIAQLQEENVQLSAEVTRFTDRIEVEIARIPVAPQAAAATTRIIKYFAPSSSAS